MFIHLDWCSAAINLTDYTHLRKVSAENACQCNLHELRPNNMPPELRTRTVLRHWSGEGYRNVCFTLVPTVASIILEWKKHGQTRSLSRAGQKMSNHSDRAPESRCADGRTFQMVTHHCRPPWSGLYGTAQGWRKAERSKDIRWKPDPEHAGAQTEPNVPLPMRQKPMSRAKNNSVDLPQWPSQTSGLNPVQHLFGENYGCLPVAPLPADGTKLN